jgi:peptidoglycan/xylan/chitin deacetylase (PgdA/CDA1 family)
MIRPAPLPAFLSSHARAACCALAASFILPLTAPIATFAGPVTTVPWNGFTGAVSFTYDDARTSQLPNLLPQLDALNLKATFYISATGTGGDFEAKKSEWIQVAKKGHELGNHTRAHVNVPADPNAAAIITDMANYLRGLDTSIESVTFAYPNCNVNGKTGIGAENFISRSCGDVKYAWATQPSDWMNIQALILTPSNTATAINSINAAKSGNSWVSLIIHDVKENPDAYSVTPANNQSMLNAAVTAKVWVDTYQNIAAYYRAHFAMDAAVASPISSGWSITWTSPHPKMPKSVKLRVKLDAATFGNRFTVRQGSVTIAPETDGAYVIDFMKLSMTVTEGTTGLKPRGILPAHLQARAARNGILYAGQDGQGGHALVGEWQATVVDVHGATVFRGKVSDGLVPLRPDQMKGILFLTLRDPSATPSGRASAAPATVRAMVQALR